MATLPKKRQRTVSPPLQTIVDPEKCIICQKVLPTQNTTSTENGRAKVIKAASVRNDIVLERLKQIDHGKIVYHVSNECYKK